MRDKRRDKNMMILEAACILHNADIDKIMKKEKYGRFDLSNWGSWLPYEVLSKIENDSLNMCETCWKTSRQYWDYGWWYTHHCLKHYILLKIKLIIRWIKKSKLLMRKVWKNITKNKAKSI